MCESVEPQGWNTNEIIRGIGTPPVNRWVFSLGCLEAAYLHQHH